MYGENKKRKARAKHANQFEVFNITSGRVVTFNDDGVSKNTGEPNQQRRHALRKFDERDADGDPLFAIVEPIPDFIRELDVWASRKMADTVASIEDRSRNPDFATLKDKYEANAGLKAEFEAEMAQKRMAPNAMLADIVKQSEKASEAAADKANAQAGIRRGRRKKAAEPAQEASDGE